MTIFAVVELEQENNKNKVLADTRVFSSREIGLSFLRRRYDAVKAAADAGAGVLAFEYSEDGWYAITDNDNNTWEGYLSEGLCVNEVMAACAGNRAKNPFIEDKSHFGSMTVRQLVEIVGDTDEFPKGLDTRVCIGDVEGNNGVNPNMMVTAHKPGDIVLSIDPHEGDEEYDPDDGGTGDAEVTA